MLSVSHKVAYNRIAQRNSEYLYPIKYKHKRIVSNYSTLMVVLLSPCIVISHGIAVLSSVCIPYLLTFTLRRYIWQNINRDNKGEFKSRMIWRCCFNNTIEKTNRLHVLSWKSPYQERQSLYWDRVQAICISYLKRIWIHIITDKYNLFMVGCMILIYQVTVP